MTLKLENDWIEKTNKIKSQYDKIIVYKILTKDLKSVFYEYSWKFGVIQEVIRKRELTKKEIDNNIIYEGFHFYLENPRSLMYIRNKRHPRPHKFQCTLYRCPCLDVYPYSGLCCLRIFKCEVQTESIIAVSNCELVATRAKLIVEV